MGREKIHFGVGIVVGLVLAALFFYYFAPRYITVKSGGVLIKQDRWSGRSWRFLDNEWKEIVNIDQKWRRIDQSLREALHVPAGGIDTTSALNMLRQRYPVLKDVTDNELLERIKLVYSKEILCNLYLKNFLKLEQESKTAKPVEATAQK